MKTEPATIITSVTALIVAVFGLVAAFGLDISPETQKAVLGVVSPTVALIFLLGPIIRNYVYAPATVEKITSKLPDATTPDVAPAPEPEKPAA